MRPMHAQTSQGEGDLNKQWLTGWVTGVDCSAAARCASDACQSLTTNDDQLWVQSSMKTSSVHGLKSNDFLGPLFPDLLSRWRCWTCFWFVHT